MSTFLWMNLQSNSLILSMVDIPLLGKIFFFFFIYNRLQSLRVRLSHPSFEIILKIFFYRVFFDNIMQIINCLLNIKPVCENTASVKFCFFVSNL